MNIEKISKITLWVLMGISAVIFILYFVVGFDNPYEENPKMNDPQFLDVVLIWGIVLTIATLILMLVSFFMYVKEYGFNKSYIYTWGLPIITLAIAHAYQQRRLECTIRHHHHRCMYRFNCHSRSHHYRCHHL